MLYPIVLVVVKEGVCTDRGQLKTSKNVQSERSATLLDGRWTTIHNYLRFCIRQPLVLSPPSPPYFHLKGGLHRPESIIIIVMDRKEWQLFVQTVQLLDSILELGTLTEQPRRSSCDPDRDHLLLRRSQEPHSGKQEIPV